MGLTRKNRSLITLTSDQRSTLERWVRARTTPQRVVLRSTIVLLASESLTITAIANRLGSSRETVRLWCERFREAGPPVLLRDRPGRGRKAHVTASAIAKATSETTGTRLSIRQLARRLGTSSSAVYRALAAHRTDAASISKRR